MLAISTEPGGLSPVLVDQRPLMNLRRSTLRVKGASATMTSLRRRAGRSRRSIDGLINPDRQSPGADGGDGDRRHDQSGDDQERVNLHSPLLRISSDRIGVSVHHCCACPPRYALTADWNDTSTGLSQVP